MIIEGLIEFCWRSLIFQTTLANLINIQPMSSIQMTGERFGPQCKPTRANLSAWGARVGNFGSLDFWGWFINFIVDNGDGDVCFWLNYLCDDIIWIKLWVEQRPLFRAGWTIFEMTLTANNRFWSWTTFFRSLAAGWGSLLFFWIPINPQKFRIFIPLKNKQMGANWT